MNLKSLSMKELYIYSLYIYKWILFSLILVTIFTTSWIYSTWQLLIKIDLSHMQVSRMLGQKGFFFSWILQWHWIIICFLRALQLGIFYHRWPCLGKYKHISTSCRVMVSVACRFLSSHLSSFYHRVKRLIFQ